MALPYTFHLLRTSAGYNQEAIADLLDIDQAGVSRIENGIQPITIEQLKKILWEFKITEAQFMTGKINPFKIVEVYNPESKKFPKKFLKDVYANFSELAPLLQFVEAYRAFQLFGENTYEALMRTTQDSYVSINFLFTLIEEFELYPANYPSIEKIIQRWISKNLIKVAHLNSFQKVIMLLAELSSFTNLFKFELLEFNLKQQQALISWKTNPSLPDNVVSKMKKYDEFFIKFYNTLFFSVLNHQSLTYELWIQEAFKHKLNGRCIFEIKPSKPVITKEDYL